MAERRMLAKRISTDSRVRQLPCPMAKLLFTWMIAHADNAGRLRAEPLYVRATVIPNESGVGDADVANWLEEMDRLGLIRLYEVDGGRYLHFPAWRKYQRLDRKASDLPSPPIMGLDTPAEPDREPVVSDREPLVTNREPVVAGRGVGGGIGSRTGREKEIDSEQESEEARTAPGMTAHGRWSASDKASVRNAHPGSCVCEECLPTPHVALTGGGR